MTDADWLDWAAKLLAPEHAEKLREIAHRFRVLEHNLAHAEKRARTLERSLFQAQIRELKLRVLLLDLSEK